MRDEKAMLAQFDLIGYSQASRNSGMTAGLANQQKRCAEGKKVESELLQTSSDRCWCCLCGFN